MENSQNAKKTSFETTKQTTHSSVHITSADKQQARPSHADVSSTSVGGDQYEGTHAALGRGVSRVDSVQAGADGSILSVANQEHALGLPNLPHQRRSIPENDSFLSDLDTTTRTASGGIEEELPMQRLGGSIDPQEAALGAMRRERLPLTELYHPYICPCDTSVQDARQRLEAALEQTRQLRKAFTERVYGKYRVCLVPPPSFQEMLQPIRQDPVAAHARLLEEMEQIRLEKEIEKKEAARMGTDTARSKHPTAKYGIEHAEQLMYVSAGLNMVILPEDNTVSAATLKDYTDGRGPLTELGQRNKAISHAAATSGDVILDRTRKAIAMRNERLRQRHDTGASQLGDAPAQGVGASSAHNQLAPAQPQHLVSPTTPSTQSAMGSVTQPAPAKLPPSSTAPKITAAKQPRARGSAVMSAASLLSLNPHSDQLDANQRPAASTAALVAGGVGHVPDTKASAQLRLRHPHPESHGGRKRAGTLSREGTSSQYSQALPEHILPPLPTTTERLEAEPLSVLTLDEAATKRAQSAVRKILQPFHGNDEHRVASVGLYHRLHRPKREGEAHSESELNPVIASLVLRSVGLIDPVNDTNHQQSLGKWFEGLPILDNNKLHRLSRDICDGPSLMDAAFSRNQHVEPTAADVNLPPVPTDSIRGGGDSLDNEDDDSESASLSLHASDQPKVDRSAELRDPATLAWHPSLPPTSVSQRLPGISGEAPPTSYIDLTQPPSVASSGLPGYLTPPERYHAASGLSGVPQRQEAYDVFVQAPNTGAMSAQSSIALGLARQNQAVAEARAMFAREQQAAALMHGTNTGFQQPGVHAQSYQQVNGAHPSAVAALLGNPNQYLSHGQYNVNSVHTPMNTQFAQAQPLLQTQVAVARETEKGSKNANHVDPNRVELPEGLAIAESKEQLVLENGSRKPLSGSGVTDSHRRSARAVASSAAPEPRSFRPKGGIVDETSIDAKASSGALSSHKQHHSTNVPSAIFPSGRMTLSSGKSSTSVKAKNPTFAEKADSGEGAHQATPARLAPLEKPSTAVEGKRVEPAESLKSAAPVNAKAKTLSPSPSFEVGLKFTEPQPPSTLQKHELQLVREGKYHEVALSSASVEKRKACFGYLLSVGAAVPIPRALVSNALKECMNTPNLKTLSATGTTAITRDVVVSTILVWLWASFEPYFQAAFHKSGRIDVDLDCKWLIHAGADLSSRELFVELADDRAISSNSLRSALAAARKNYQTQKQAAALDPSKERDLSSFQLDQSRLAALESKAVERTYLASLVSRKAMMTDSFSHAYLSAMVRAGETLGHDQVFKAVQNKETGTSSMMYCDVFVDETSEWEDSCRPPDGVTTRLSADGLTRRAHSRAMIQKSLRKLQDKHGLNHGAVSAGPYGESLNSFYKLNQTAKHPPATSPRATLKRKHSNLEPPVLPGSGSARIPNWGVFHPRHFTEAVEWNVSALSNLPYGKHSTLDRPRSLSLSLSARTNEGKRPKKLKLSDHRKHEEPTQGDGAMKRSTLEIPWSDVADIFQHVEVPKKASSGRSSSGHNHESTPVPADGKIFAPFCRKVGDLPSDNSESDGEEDTSDATVLRQHEVVLDHMKQKMAAYVEARRLQQERRKNRSKGRS